MLTCCSSDRGRRAEGPRLFLPDDLEATLWAESPMFFNPANMDVDQRGRVWIAEAVNYRASSNDSTSFFHHPEGDRIMILEDTDGDGKADSSKVFVTDKDLIAPLGIAVIGNRVYVSCSPNLIVYTDENGDDVPDKKEIFLAGFGGKDHDHSLHALVGGPDGQLYFNAGDAGPHYVKDRSGWTLRSGSIYTGGSPYNRENHGNQKSDDGKVWVGGLALRVATDGTGLKVMGHNFRNAYELTVDSYGNLWQNDNDDEVAACRTSWLMEGGNAGFFSNDGTRTWQADQRPWQDVFTAHWHQDDPGVIPAGDRSGSGAPTGIVLNEGDALGEQYRGMLLSADAGRNVIFGYSPSVSSSGYDLGKRKNLISSIPEDNPDYIWSDSAENAKKEKWFRPSDVAIGTDGAIYIADWYDGIVGGHAMQDSLARGRIYRITPKGKKLTAPTLDFNTVAGLLEAFKSPAINVRHAAFEKLRAKGEEVIAPVSEMAESKNPYYQARAVWLLSRLGNAGLAEVEKLLGHQDQLVRATAFRAIRQAVPDILPYAEKMARDTSAFVRREVAIALAGVPFDKAKPLLGILATHAGGQDKWLLAALQSAAEGNENKMYRYCKQIFGETNNPGEWSERMASIAWALHPSSSVNDLTQRASSAGVDKKQRSDALTAISLINTREAVNAMAGLIHSPLPDVAEQATYWLSFREGNTWFSFADRKKEGIDMALQRRLNEMKVRKSKIMEERLPLPQKKWAAKEMARDSLGGQMLLDMIAAKQLPESLYAVAEEGIFSNPSQDVRLRAANYFKRPAGNFSVPSIIALKADAKEGERIFLNNCTTCHRIGDKGKNIGPELTFIHKKFDREKLLDAIIDPSASILLGYEPWSITTKEGRSFFGFLVADGGETVTIRDLTEKNHTIATSSIVTRTRMEKSLMPAPAELGLTQQNLADISAYLMNRK